jgi:uncharacterized protein (DUF362 family)
MKPVVFLERLAQDFESSKNQFSRSFESLSIHADFERANAVFIKPNLTYPIYKKGVTTRKEFVESLVAALREINSRTRIYIGEGEGGYNSFSMTQAMLNMGFCEIEERYSNVNIVNLSDLPSRVAEFQVKGKPYWIKLPSSFFDEIDFSISCPLPKVHGMTGVSLSIKNQWGCLPDTMRLKNHYVFDHIIGQICNTLRFKYAFLDGKYGLNSNGPIIGDPVMVNWFVASNSVGAFDTVVCQLMGYDWKRFRHLRACERYGFIPGEEQIRIIGNIDELKKTFKLRRTFWHYPAFAAFYSKGLTHLFYFSRWAKPLHDIMYTLRTIPIPDDN